MSERVFDSKVTAPFRLGFRHFIALTMSAYLRANRGFFGGWLSLLVPAVFAIGVALATLPRRYAFETQSPVPRLLSTLLVACLIFLGWFALGFAALCLRTLKIWRKYAADPRITSPRTLSLSADGVEMFRDGERKDFTWQQVTDIYRSMGCIFMPLDNGQCHIVPETAFPDAAAVASFYNIAVEFKNLSPIVSVFSAPAPGSTPRA